MSAVYSRYSWLNADYLSSYSVFTMREIYAVPQPHEYLPPFTLLSLLLLC